MQYMVGGGGGLGAVLSEGFKPEALTQIFPEGILVDMVQHKDTLKKKTKKTVDAFSLFLCVVFLFCNVLYFEVLSYFGESTE